MRALALVLCLGTALAADTLPLANFPKVPKGTAAGSPRACPIPLVENFCAPDANNIADVLTRHDAEIDVLQALGLDDLANPSGDKTFQMGDNHLEFRWTSPVTGPQFDGALELQAAGNFSGDLVHIHQFTGNPPAGTHLLHLESNDVDVVPIHIAAGGTTALTTNKALRAGSFVVDASGLSIASGLAACASGLHRYTGSAWQCVALPTCASNQALTNTASGFACVTIDGGTTPALSGSSTYYVSKTGSGTTCSFASPCGTIATGIGKLAAGDTLYIRGAPVDGTAATYTEAITLNPSSPKGTAASRITIAAYPGEVVRLQPASGTNVIRIEDGGGTATYNADPVNCAYARCHASAPQYVTFKGLILDGTNTTAANIWFDPYGTATPDQFNSGHHIRFESVESRNSKQDGIYVAGGAYNEFVDMLVHDNGDGVGNQAHGVYLSGKWNTFTGGKFYANECMGAQVLGAYGSDASDNVFDGVEVYANGEVTGDCGAGDTGAQVGIGIFGGLRNVVRNSSIHHNTHAGVYVQEGAAETLIEANSVWSNNQTTGAFEGGIYVDDESWAMFAWNHETLERDGNWDGVAASHDATNTVLRSNKLWGNYGGNTAPLDTAQDPDQNQIKDEPAVNTTFSGNYVGP